MRTVVAERVYAAITRGAAGRQPEPRRTDPYYGRGLEPRDTAVRGLKWADTRG